MRDSNKGVPQHEIDKLFSGEISEKEFERKWGTPTLFDRHGKVLLIGLSLVWLLLGFIIVRYVFS